MRTEIQEIILNHPKRYSQIIKKNSEMWSWVLANTQITEGSIAATIFSAVSGTPGMCPQGCSQPLLNQQAGWGYCGPAKTCVCLAQNFSKKVSIAKCSYTADKKVSIKQKRQDTMLTTYGVAYNSQRADIHHIWSKHKTSDAVSALLNDETWLREQYINQSRSLVDIADQLGIYYSTVSDHLKKFGVVIRQRSQYSREELAVSTWLTSLSVPHETSNWDMLGNLELDLYLPTHKLAIEINGLYWHSWHPSKNSPEKRNHHLIKSQRCAELGITLLHITDWQWHNQPDIVQSIIQSKLGVNQKIGARKCVVKSITSKQSSTFLKKYHLQGAGAAAHHFGLFYQDQLSQVITIGASRWNKEYPWELIRMCSQPGVNITGGLSRLIAYAKSSIGCAEILTYCDRSISNGVGYQAAGFKLLRTTDPGYCWTNGTVTVSRYRSQKHQLGKWLSNFDPALSESENMFAAGWRRYWDCGNWVLLG